MPHAFGAEKAPGGHWGQRSPAGGWGETISLHLAHLLLFPCSEFSREEGSRAEEEERRVLSWRNQTPSLTLSSNWGTTREFRIQIIALPRYGRFETGGSLSSQVDSRDSLLSVQILFELPSPLKYSISLLLRLSASGLLLILLFLLVYFRITFSHITCHIFPYFACCFVS